MNIITNGFDVKNHLAGKSDVIIYGIGEYGKFCFDFCALNQVKITAFIDNYSAETYRDIKTYKPEEMFEKIGGGGGDVYYIS
jgi:hypothetical protein